MAQPSRVTMMTDITLDEDAGPQVTCGQQRPKPRDRIIDTARDLFRHHGFRAVGVDAIAEAAGTNKMTLYRHFGSKDDLIVACLRQLVVESDVIWDRLRADHQGDPVGLLHGWVHRVADYVIADERGCDMSNAAAELAEPDHPARRLIEGVKTTQRNRLEALCRDAGVMQADLLADTLWLLVEGARVNRQNVGAEGPNARFIRIAEVVIAAFLANPDLKPVIKAG